MWGEERLSAVAIRRPAHGEQQRRVIVFIIKISLRSCCYLSTLISTPLHPLSALSFSPSPPSALHAVIVVLWVTTSSSDMRENVLWRARQIPGFMCTTSTKGQKETTKGIKKERIRIKGKTVTVLLLLLPSYTDGNDSDYGCSAFTERVHCLYCFGSSSI